MDLTENSVLMCALKSIGLSWVIIIVPIKNKTTTNICGVYLIFRHTHHTADGRNPAPAPVGFSDYPCLSHDNLNSYQLVQNFSHPQNHLYWFSGGFNHLEKYVCSSVGKDYSRIYYWEGLSHILSHILWKNNHLQAVFICWDPLQTPWNSLKVGDS